MVSNRISMFSDHSNLIFKYCISLFNELLNFRSFFNALPTNLLCQYRLFNAYAEINSNILEIESFYSEIDFFKLTSKNRTKLTNDLFFSVVLHEIFEKYKLSVFCV